MQRALDLAERGKGSVHPNPLVGCVLVHAGKIIGEGYHEFYGGPHAEVNAINSVKNKDLWIKLYDLNKSLSVEWYWVKAHAGNPMNEEVDLLAKKAANLD